MGEARWVYKLYFAEFLVLRAVVLQAIEFRRLLHGVNDEDEERYRWREKTKRLEYTKNLQLLYKPFHRLDFGTCPISSTSMPLQVVLNRRASFKTPSMRFCPHLQAHTCHNATVSGSRRATSG